MGTAILDFVDELANIAFDVSDGMEDGIGIFLGPRYLKIVGPGCNKYMLLVC